MDFRIHVGLVLLCFAVILPSYGDPIARESTDRPKTIGSGLFKSFDEVANFLRVWYDKLQTRVRGFADLSSGSTVIENHPRNLSKREIKPPQNFEEIEHLYLLKLSREYLEQLFDYAKFLNNDNRDNIDQVLKHEVEKLRLMTLDQLKAYCAKLQAAMASGISLNNEITVNGNTYSLESIAQVCCPWG